MSVFCGCTPQIVSHTPTISSSLLTQDFTDSVRVFTSVSGLVDVQVRVGDKKFSGNHALFAQTPNRLRADLLGLFGRPVYMLASDGETITYYLPDENKYFKSLSNAENFYRLTHIPLTAEDFVGLLLGRLPSITDAGFYADIDNDGYHVVTLTGTNGLRQELRYNQLKQLVAGRVWHGSRLLMSVEYSVFTVEGFATLIRLDFPESRTRASIEFDAPKVDTKIPVQRFDLSIPDGVIRIDLNRT